MADLPNKNPKKADINDIVKTGGIIDTKAGTAENNAKAYADQVVQALADGRVADAEALLAKIDVL